MALKVIGTGFGRTGTESMRAALEILGFGPCHHMNALTGNTEHRDQWRRIACGAETDLDTVLAGYGACVDWPSAYYWPHLVRAHPEAKVILTWRSPESWWTSFSRTILPVLLNSTETEASHPGSQLLPLRVFGGLPLTRETCIAAYQANATRVRAEIATDRLLVHALGDGWEPLCEFLGVPIPDMPYPRSNDTSSFNRPPSQPWRASRKQ